MPANTCRNQLPHDIEQKFKLYLNNFCTMAEKWGFSLVPYSTRTWAKFKTLSSICQQDLFEKFRTYYELCDQAIHSGVALNDDRALVWYALKVMKNRPGSDLMDKIENGDIVEIHNKDGIQVFRNLRFFEISGYTLGDIFTHTWQELYTRDPEDVKLIIEVATDILTGKIHEVRDCSYMREHRLEEAFSAEGHIMNLKFKFFAPIYLQHGQEVAGTLCTSSVEIVDKNPRKVIPRETFESNLAVLSEPTSPA